MESINKTNTIHNLYIGNNYYNEQKNTNSEMIIESPIPYGSSSDKISKNDNETLCINYQYSITKFPKDLKYTFINDEIENQHLHQLCEYHFNNCGIDYKVSRLVRIIKNTDNIFIYGVTWRCCDEITYETGDDFSDQDWFIINKELNRFEKKRKIENLDVDNIDMDFDNEINNFY